MGVVEINPKPCVEHEDCRDDIVVEPINRSFGVKMLYGGHKSVGTSCSCTCPSRKINCAETQPIFFHQRWVRLFNSFQVLSLFLNSNVKTYAMRLAKFH